MNGVKEMDPFLETCLLRRLNYEETENLNRSIINKEIESIIKTHITKKCPRTDGFTGEFKQTFREELIAILLKLAQKVKE